MTGTTILPPAALDPTQWALFLDIDGTLLDFQATPQAVVSHAQLNRLLQSLAGQLGGAVALVSGRTLVEIDRIFSPHKFVAVGGHGTEFRLNDQAQAVPDLPTLPNETRARAEALQAEQPGLLLEHKPHGVAMHYRGAPAAQTVVHDWARQECERLGAAFRLMIGKMVYELIPTNAGKDTAINHMLTHQPFIGRKPIFIGDDITDEPGFELVNNLQGLSIRVGTKPGSTATQQLENVAAVHTWLSEAFV